MLIPPRLVAFIIDGLWLVFAVYWLVNAFGNKKSVYRQGRLSRLLYLAAMLAFIYVIIHLRRLDMRLLPYNIITQVVGMVLCAAGIAIAIWARRVLGGNWSGIVTLKQDHVLIRHGPYRLVRHPIYSGIILAAAGSFVATLPTIQGLICMVYLIVGFRLKSLFEEQLLARQFPQDYPRYKREVRALIPFVY